MNYTLPEDTYWVLLIFASQWLTWCSKSSQSPYFYKFPRWFLCVLKFRKHGLDSRAASLRRHLLFCTSLRFTGDADAAGLQIMLSGAARVYSRRSWQTTACRPNPDSHWVLFKKEKKVLSKRMNAAKFLRLHSIFDCLWTTTQSWVVAAEMYGLQSFPIWLSVYRKSLPISGTDDLVLKLHKCIVLINSFLCIKKNHKNHLPVLLSALKKTAIKLAILCKCVSWLISTVI